MTWVVQIFNRDGYYTHVSAATKLEVRAQADQRLARMSKASRDSMVAMSIPFEARFTGQRILDITLPEDFKLELSALDKGSED